MILLHGSSRCHLSHEWERLGRRRESLQWDYGEQHVKKVALIKQNKIDKDYATCKNSLVKLKYTGNTTNMQSHFQCHHPDLLVENVINANVASQQWMQCLRQSFLSRHRGLPLLRSPLLSLVGRTLARTAWTKIKVSAKYCKHWSHGMKWLAEKYFPKIAGKFKDALKSA